MNEVKKVALISLGCAKNQVDSEVMLGRLAASGYRFVARPEEADIIIVNTCGFIGPARREAEETLRQALALNTKREGKRIIAAGCHVERDLEGLKKRFPAVDGWLGVGGFDTIVDVVEGRANEAFGPCFLYDHTSPRMMTKPASWAYVKISEGCSRRCSFCAIPLIKGPYRSRPIESVILEVERLSSLGVREVDIVSQDSTFYGRDLGLSDGLSRLLRSLLKRTPVEWIRTLYGYPEEVDDALLETMQDDRICSYLDIPFQHSSPRLVKAMGRGLDGRQALRLLDRIRSRLPGVAVRTSLIVGFPGEEKGDFRSLEDFVREARFDHLGVFTYSPEKGTACFGLGDPVPDSLKEERKGRIMDIQARLSRELLRRFVGRRIEVLLEGRLKEETGVWMGRGRFQAPEVDGAVFIDTGQTGPRADSPLQPVEITGSDVYDLFGEFVT